MRLALGMGLAVLMGLVVTPALGAEKVETLRLVQTVVSEQSVDVGQGGSIHRRSALRLPHAPSCRT